MSDDRGLTSHGFIFGTKIEDTVAWIMRDALAAATPENPEPLREASFQLKGIDRLLGMMGMSVAAMMLSNDRVKIDELLDAMGAPRAYLR